MNNLTSAQITSIYQANPDNQDGGYQLALKYGIPLWHTGFETLAIYRTQDGQDFLLLLHKILILIYLDKENQYQNLQEIILSSFVSYVNNSIPKKVLTLDNSTFSNSLSKRYNISIQMLTKYLEPTMIKDQSFDQDVVRRIEFCAYYLLVGIKDDLLDYLEISTEQHYSFNQQEGNCRDTEFLISRCFLPTASRSGEYLKGINLFISQEKKYDRWLQSQIPELIIRGVFVHNTETTDSQAFDPNSLLKKLKSLIKNPSEIKKTLEGEDKTVVTFLAFLGLLIIWKDGFAIFGFIPIFGDLFSTLGNTVYGRMLGVVIYGSLLIDYQFSFSIRNMTKGDNKIILIFLLLILFVSALLV